MNLWTWTSLIHAFKDSFVEISFGVGPWPKPLMGDRPMSNQNPIVVFLSVTPP
jgi:hypothetical protein